MQSDSLKTPQNTISIYSYLKRCKIAKVFCNNAIEEIKSSFQKKAFSKQVLKKYIEYINNSNLL